MQHEEDAWAAKMEAHKQAIDSGTPPEDAPPKPEGDKPVPEVPPSTPPATSSGASIGNTAASSTSPKSASSPTPRPPLTEEGKSPLYGWAGWTHLQRAKALMHLDELAEEAGVDTEDRHGLLYTLQFLLPYVRWGDAAAQSAADEFAAILRDLSGEAGVTEDQHPPPKTRATRRKKKATKRKSRKKKGAAAQP